MNFGSLYIQGDKGHHFQIKIVFQSLKIVLISTNSADSDDILHSVAFHQDLHSLPMYRFKSNQ